MLQVGHNDISRRKWSGDTAQLRGTLFLSYNIRLQLQYVPSRKCHRLWAALVWDLAKERTIENNY